MPGSVGTSQASSRRGSRKPARKDEGMEATGREKGGGRGGWGEDRERAEGSDKQISEVGEQHDREAESPSRFGRAAAGERRGKVAVA